MKAKNWQKHRKSVKNVFPYGETVRDFYEVSLAIYDKDGKKLDSDANQFNKAIAFSLDTEGKGNSALVYNKATDNFGFEVNPVHRTGEIKPSWYDTIN